jgi:uncharacterized protein (TIGR00297 family)
MSISGLALGVIVSTLIAAASIWARFLTRDGAAAAVLVGTPTIGFGGWGFATMLGAFFVTSSLLTRWQRGRKMQAAPRTSRDAAQVLANGGVAAAFAVIWGLWRADAAAAGFAAALAAATADTWATEVGLLNRRPPHLITTWQKVSPGRSGGVTGLGTAAAVAGAAVIGGIAGIVGVPAWIPWVTGVVAMLLDSLLGATLEGRRGVTNDTVNFLATLFAAAAGAALRFAF